MISAKRIISIFRKKGGTGELTKPADEFTEAELAPLREDMGNEAPLIASIRSLDEWFVLSVSHLVLKSGDALRRVPLDDVERIDIDANREYKFRGGKLDVRLRDGSSVSIKVESPRPYVALMNVFLYIARVTRQPSHKALTSARRAKTLL